MIKTLLTLMLLVGALLTACGDGDGVQTQPPDAASAPEPVGRIDRSDVGPAQVISLSLKELDLPAGADKVTPSGAVSDALLKDGQLRFSTPGDTGEDQEAAFEIRSGATTSVRHLLLRSPRPTDVEANEHTLGESPPLPELTIEGLGPDNALTGAPLTFRVKGLSAPDLKDFSRGWIAGATAERAYDLLVKLDDFWSFNPEDSSLSISGPAMQRILGMLPKGDFELGLNLSSRANGKEFTAVYYARVMKADARLSGKLLSQQGDPVSSLAGRKVLLEGIHTQMRAVAVLDANGAFAFERVLPDVYFLTLSDLDYPNAIRISFPIYEDSTQAQVSMVVPPGLGVDTGAKTAAKRTPSGSLAARSSVTQDGKGPAARSIPATKRSAPSAPLSAEGVDRAVFSATAVEQDQPVNKKIDFMVPVGTESVGVKITVFAEESLFYPVMSMAEMRQLAEKRLQSGERPPKKRKYNDSWSYSVVGLPDTQLSASGVISEVRRYDIQGRMTKTMCVDVAKQTKNAALSISGSVGATNIGDKLLPITTTVELTLECRKLKSSSAKIEVSSAKFLSPNKNSEPVISPIRVGGNTRDELINKLAGNLAGLYLSIPKGSSDNTHTIPLEINYSPADANITEVNVGINGLISGSTGGIPPNFSTVNLLTQNHTSTPGQIKFPGISLPIFPNQVIRERGGVAITVRLKGSVGGVEVSSDPAAGGRVAFSDGRNEFKPLYLAGEVEGLSGRRYGPRDNGGDSWATAQTIEKLLASPYPFNDISSQHVTQNSAGGSILIHKGHSDGQQIDMRYADGQGGYSEALGGANNGEYIKQLIYAAASEVKNNVTPKPKMIALNDWILKNRSMLTVEARHHKTRIIYIGDSFIEDALVHGKFPSASAAGSVAIPGWGEWTDKPWIVRPEREHLHHWHLSFSDEKV
ncbi:hypothetical protein [Verminephrobacter aporrectodeae]|uniref:hypothetical protein n=1 Tax=Verminephrobacter aporrectodeae TaxID=1110389 RepID=UPI002238116F|nr:hypothetical protein [Verminephrobacter aporrectodeae]